MLNTAKALRTDGSKMPLCVAAAPAAMMVSTCSTEYADVQNASLTGEGSGRKGSAVNHGRRFSITRRPTDLLEEELRFPLGTGPFGLQVSRPQYGSVPLPPEWPSPNKVARCCS